MSEPAFGSGVIDLLENKKFHVESYGCTFNHADTQKLIEYAEAHGCTRVPGTEAEVFLLNTCTVVAATERTMLRRLQAMQDKKILVTGCMPVVQANLIRSVCNPVFLPPRDLYCLNKRIGAVLSPGVGAVQVATGCRGHCSYCLTRLARGSLQSYPETKIVDEVRALVDAGVREIQLTGQDVSAYGRDRNTTLAALLDSLAGIRGDFMVRVGMMNPATVIDILEDLTAAWAHENIFSFVHIPVQSGSDRVLEAMERGYAAKDVVEIVQSFRRALPKVRISTDFITGFPTETDEDFNESLRLLTGIRPTKVNITRYSQRPGTVAEDLYDMPDSVKKDRSRILTAAANQLYDEENARHIGREVPVTVTEAKKKGSVVARDQSYNNIVIPEVLPLGSACHVRIVGHRRHYLIGERVRPDKGYVPHTTTIT
jgi:threonylcarbamoyladenosine tRNA methylthiotransferase CDKAL1